MAMGSLLTCLWFTEKCYTLEDKINNKQVKPLGFDTPEGGLQKSKASENLGICFI